jgi:GNAT superfamily N-acetyltransferase
MEIAVRPARLADAEAVVRVHEEASAHEFLELVGRSFDEVFPLEERLGECRRSLAEPAESGQTLVAARGGEIVGMAVWRLRGVTDGELSDLHVVPAEWGAGTGRALLQAAVDGLLRAGAVDMCLWVGEANARARRFYEREGWRFDGTARASELGPRELRYRFRIGRQQRSE